MDKSHGSPYDRGGANYYYNLPFNPHYYPDGTYIGKRIDPTNGMTDEQVEEYRQGWLDAAKIDDRKVW